MIERALRPHFGNRVFGCDDCLGVCPWNKFASQAHDAKLALHAHLENLSLAQLAALDDAAFRALFAGTPIKRTGRDRFVRNVLYAIGNSGLPDLADHAAVLQADPDPTVAEAAAWALARLNTRS